MKKFVLIDGNAMMHRAFHALPPLNNSKGEMVNAVYGFFSMLLKILEDLKPSYIAVCFDRPKPTFRKTLYAGYQAKRPAMSDDLPHQFTIVHELLEKTGISIFEIDGYEADDIIGTLAFQAQSLKNQKSKIKNQKEEAEVIIVSGDRDLLQLVNSRVKMLAPLKGMTEMTLYDFEKVEEKFGIKPSQMIDYKALVGDASDNYPGVSGIGPKTAASLLQEFGSFESLYQHLGELPPKLSEKLATDAEQASLAKKLATIVTDAPVSFKAEECLVSHMSREKLIESFEDLGFQSLVKRMSSAKQNPENKKTANTHAQKKDETQKQDKNEQLGLL